MNFLQPAPGPTSINMKTMMARQLRRKIQRKKEKDEKNKADN
jgi:hypothetical protein